MTWEQLLAMGAPAGVWLWESYGNDAVKALAKKVDDAAKGTAGVTWYQFEWQRAAQNYRDKVYEQYGRVTLLNQKERALDDLYTNLNLLGELTRTRYLDTRMLGKEGFEKNDAQQWTISGLDLIKKNDSPRVLVFGKPGAGKTTFCKHLVLQACGGGIPKVPIFVWLKRWADDPTFPDLLAFIAKQFDICDFPDAAPFIEYILKENKALVLLDGLDEINLEGGQRKRAIDAVQDFADKYHTTQMVLTCRPAAMDAHLNGFRAVEVADFDEQQVRQFIGNWFQGDAERLQKFLAEFNKLHNKGLRELASVPVLLSLICIAFEHTGEMPPNRRIEIYKQAVDALLYKWNASKNLTPDPIYDGLTLERKRGLLEFVAAETFDNGEYLIPRKRVSTLISEYLHTLPNSPDKPTDRHAQIEGYPVLQAMEAQHGLLVERAQDVYSFSHLSLHEYFAACHAKENTEEGVLNRARLLLPEHLIDDRWREVLLNAAAMGTANSLLMGMLDAAEALLQNDDAPLQMLRWASQRCEHDLQAYPLGLNGRNRATVVVIFSTLDLDSTRALALDLALGLDHTLARDLTRAFKHNLTHALDCARTLAFDLNRTLGRGRALALDRAIDGGLPLDLGHALAFAPDQAYQLDFLSGMLVEYGQFFAENVQNQRVLQIQPQLVQFMEVVRHIAGEVGDTKWQSWLDQTHVPTKNDLPETWRTFAQTLRQATIQHRNVGHDWGLGEEQWKRLANYLQATKLIVDCMEVAALSPKARAVIENRLLLPRAASA
jgi:NACHT domain